MKIKLLELETELLGANVIRLDDWESAAEIVGAEADLISDYNPFYVNCEVEATDLSTIHTLEQNGYTFSELRIYSMLRTEQVDDVTRSFYPYVAKSISDESDLENAIAMLAAANADDRFSNDPVIGKEIAKERMIRNLQKSFHAQPKEFLLGVYNDQTKELVAFRSGLLMSRSEACYYQYGVTPSKDFNHTASMLESFAITHLKNIGIKLIHCITTGFNISELDRFIRDYCFKVKASRVMMRKIFMNTKQSVR
jgi:hypothetical protein